MSGSENKTRLNADLLQGAGELVRAAGSALLAVDSFQHAYDILHLPSFTEACYALGVAVAAFDEVYAPDGVAFGFDVDLLGADNAAGPE